MVTATRWARLTFGLTICCGTGWTAFACVALKYVKRRGRPARCVSGVAELCHRSWSASVPLDWSGEHKTFTAIDAIAHEHPEGAGEHIAGAYDAFAREHGVADVVEPPNA